MSAEAIVVVHQVSATMVMFVGVLACTLLEMRTHGPASSLRMPRVTAKRLERNGRAKSTVKTWRRTPLSPSGQALDEVGLIWTEPYSACTGRTVDDRDCRA